MKGSKFFGWLRKYIIVVNYQKYRCNVKLRWFVYDINKVLLINDEFTIHNWYELSSGCNCKVIVIFQCKKTPIKQHPQISWNSRT